MATINQRNQQNTRCQDQVQFQNPQHLVISFWVFTNYEQARDFKLILEYQDQKQQFSFQSSNLTLRDLNSTVKWCQFDFYVSKDLEPVFKDRHFRKYLKSNFCFTFEYQKSPLPTKIALRIENYSLKNPIIAVSFVFYPSQTNIDELENLIIQVIQRSMYSSQQSHLKEFLIQFKVQNFLMNKSRNEKKLTELMDLMEKSPIESFLYYFVVLEFYDLGKISCWNIVYNKLVQLKEMFCRVCLKFDLLMSFWETQKVQNQILTLTAKMVVRLKSLNKEGLLLRDIVEKYYGPSINDLERRSLENMRPYVLTQLKNLDPSEASEKKYLNLKFPEIEFLLGSDNDSNQVLVSWTESIDVLLKLMTFCKKCEFDDEFYVAVGRRLVQYFESKKYLELSNEQIIEFFKIMDAFEKTQFESIVKTSNVSYYVICIIRVACEKDDLFEKIIQYLAKYHKINGHGLMPAVVNYFSEESNIQFKKIFKFSFDHSDLSNDLEKNLKLVYEKQPSVIFKNFEEIYKINQTNPKRNFTQNLFDLIEMNLDNFEQKGLEQFRKHVSNEDIIRDAVESMIKFQIEFYHTSSNIRQIVINQILKVAQERKKWWFNDQFINYILNKIQNHMKIEDPNSWIRNIFEELSQRKIEETINMIESAESSKNDEIEKFKRLLSKEFEDLAEGKLTVERYLKFNQNYKENSGLKRLFQKLHPLGEFRLYSSRNYNLALEKLVNMQSIFTRWCIGCSDRESILNEIANFEEEYKSKSVIEFIKACKDYMIDINWDEIFILNKDINKNIFSLKMLNLNSGNRQKMTCAERLGHITEELNKLKFAVKKIENEFKSMTLAKVRNELEVENDNDLDQYVQSFFSNEESKRNFQLCLKIIKNLSSVKIYFDIYENIQTQLNLKMKDQEIKKKQIQSMRKLDEKTFPLGEFEKCAEFFRKYFDDFELIKELSEKFAFVIGFKESLKLLNGGKYKFDRFKDLVNDFKDNEITWNNINDLEIIQSFFEILQNKSKKLDGGCFVNLGHFEKVFDEISKMELYSDILLKIREYHQDYNKYSQFFKDSLNTTESLKQWITSFMKNSVLTIHLSSESIKYSILKKTEKEEISKIFRYDELEEKRNVILMKGSPNTNQKKLVVRNNGLRVPSQHEIEEEDEAFQSQKAYVDLFRQLEILNDVVDEMKNYGYDFSKSENRFQIMNCKFEALEDLVKDMRKKYESFKEQMSKAYKSHFLFTFLRHCMINQLARSLKEPTETIQNSFFLNYLGFKNQDHMTIRRYFNEKIPKIVPEIITQKMEELFNEKLTKMSSLYEQNQLPSKTQLSPNLLYIVKIPKRDNKNMLYKTILGVSLHANGRLPNFHNILFCSSAIIQSQMQPFMNRVYNCPNNQAFMIILPEYLNLEDQQEMIKLILEIRQKEKNAYLFILCSDLTSSVPLHCLEQKNRMAFSLDDSVYNKDITEKIHMMSENVVVVVSGHPLTGKTTWIINEAKSRHKEWKIIHIRLTGVVDFESIFDALFQAIDRREVVIHLDIGPIHSKSMRALDELLFSLIFLKTLETMDRVIVIPKESKFYLEFDCSMNPREGKESIEFFQFPFKTVDKIQNGVTQLISVSDIPLLFFKSSKCNTLHEWNGSSLEDQLIIYKDTRTQKIAEINVGLDETKPRLTAKITSPEDLKRLEELKKLKELRKLVDSELKEFEELKKKGGLGSKEFEELKNDFFRFLQTNREGEKSQGMLAYQLIFQRVFHFFTYNYSQCGFLNYKHTLSANDSPKIGEFIFNSAKYLTTSSFNSLQLQQAAHANIFANRSSVNDIAENLDQMTEKIQKWNKENTLFITFNEGYPIIVFTKMSQIPECIKKVDREEPLMENLNGVQKVFVEKAQENYQPIRFHDISDNNHERTKRMEKHEIHNKYFTELAHLNPKLNNCKFCEKCFMKYNLKDCSECEKEGFSAADFWSVNRNSDYIKAIIDSIPPINGIKEINENHKIEALFSYLEDTFGRQTANQMKTTSEKQLICLNCKKLIPLKCKTCSNDFMNAQRHFELNKDNETFRRIHDENVKQKRLKKIDPKSQKTYHVFDSEINKEFISFISRSLFNHYVLTFDNFSKILQIHVRAKSRLPIIILGETGCGKTSLIKFLCRYILDDHFEFYPMHAGVYESKFVKKVHQFFDKCESDFPRDCWILFDEFNTSDAIGLVKTLMIDRRLGNRTAPVNAIFIATCNPFKVKKAKSIQDHLVGLKRNIHETRAEQTSLVYNVHPLPESLFYFTFDFGQLAEEDEKQYAESILNRAFLQTSNSKVESINFNQLREESQIISNVCIEINKYLKSEFDISSTSLRDVRRFEVVLAFFKRKYFPAIEKEEKSLDDTPKNITKKCLVLSVMVCYCLRLSEQKQREKVMDIVKKYTGISQDQFLKIVEDETDRLLKQFKFDNSVIKNKALSENILSMFVCLLNKIPLIVIGKPGSSKSLSVQLLFQKLKGEKAENFFRNFEELAMISYQGSEYSTSESIELIFEKAEKMLESKNRIPVIVFDEIGLAEISRNNPLKVLHSRLEMEDVKVGFLGVSNWFLDSSKMNRVLTVWRKDPDEEELKKTARDLGASLVKSSCQKDLCFELLAVVYYRHKREIESKKEKNQGVAGLRDFYHLIKQTAKEYNLSGPRGNSANKDTIVKAFHKAAIYSIRRNFSYNSDYCQNMCNSLTMELEILQETNIVPESITVNDLLAGNLNDPKSRPLMVITNQEEVHNRVYNVLARQSDIEDTARKTYRVLIGSRFEKDIEEEAYCVEVISKIIHYMDQDIILVMHQLDAVYTSLYDLFNQNFKKEGKKDYCRIVQGTISKCLYPVHENFKVVLFITKEQLENADEPLINRFEKYSLTHKDFITQKNERRIKKIKHLFDAIFSTKTEEDRLAKGKQVFGNFSEMSYLKWTDDIKAFNSEENQVESDLVLVEMVQMMRGISSLHLAKHLFKNTGIRKSEAYLKIFLDFKKRSLINFIKEIIQSEKSEKRIVYTFSSVFENILKKMKRDFDEKMSLSKNKSDLEKLDFDENDEFFKNFVLSDKVEEQLVSTMKSEKSFTETFKSFLNNKKSVLLILKVNGSNETQHMFYLQNAISNMLNDHKGITKHAIICVHHKPSTIAKIQSFPLSTDWKEMFIDDLFKGLEETTKEIMLKPDITSAVNHSIGRLKAEFDGMIDKIIFDKQTKEADQTYLDRMTRYFQNFTQKYGADFRDLITDMILRAISDVRSAKASQTVYDLVDKRSDFLNNSESFVQRIESAINRIFESKLKNLVDYFLKAGIPDSMMFAINRKSDQLKAHIERMINSLVTNEHINEPMKTDINEPPCALIYPYTHLEYQRIIEIDRKQFGNDDGVVDLIFNGYKSVSFFISKRYLIYDYEPNIMSYVVIDLVKLHLTRQNVECPPNDLLLIVFEKMIHSKVLDVFKLFVFDPDLATNLCVLLTNLVDILKITNKSNSGDFLTFVAELLNKIDENYVSIKENFSYKQSMGFFMRLINELTPRTLTQSILSSNLSNFRKKYSGLKHSIENFQENKDLQLLKLESLDLLFIIGDFIDQSCINNSLIYRLINSNYELLNKLDFQNFPSTFSSLKRILPGCSYEKLIEERLLTFEVMYYQKQIEGCITNDDKDKMKFLFEKVFERVEECENFALLSDSIINSLIKKSEVKKSISLFFENNETFADNTKDNLGKWLEKCLGKYSKRLPYLIISGLKSEVESVLNNSKDLTQSKSFKNVLSNLTHYDKVDIVFNKTALINLTIIRFFTNRLSHDMLEPKQKDSVIFALLTRFLNENSCSAKSLQLYICKNIKKMRCFTNQQLDDKLKNSNEEWPKKLCQEIETERQNFSLTPESYCFNSDNHYKNLIEVFKVIEDSNSDDLKRLLNYLKAHNDNNGLLSFYSLMINNYYFKRNSSKITIQKLITRVQKFKLEFSDLLGSVGYSFIEKILSNFDPNSPLRLTENSDKSSIQRNSSILFAFASILCHKNKNSHFNQLIFGCKSRNYFNHLKECYLPGMILPPNTTVNSMVVFIDNLRVDWTNHPANAVYQTNRKIWKCSENCDYFFIFGDCGQPNLQRVKFTCPVCNKKEIGAKSHGVALDHHKGYSKEEGEKYIKNYIEKYKTSYSKGYFNFGNSISDITEEGLNVSALTTNTLNFLTNSMVLVLNELKIAENKISDLIFSPNHNPNEVLLDKISKNFDKCRSKFPLAEVSIFMNLLSAKISSGLNNLNSIETVELYYEMERKIESDVLSCIFSDDQKNYKEYCQNLSKSTMISVPKDSIISYIEETNQDNCDRFSLIYHLRLDSLEMYCIQFVDTFKSVPTNKLRNPNTHSLFSHLTDLQSLKVLLAYKDFYDEFREKFNGVFERAQAEKKSIEECSLKHTNPEIFKKLKNFINLWNLWVEKASAIQYECQNFKLSEISCKHPLTQVLPNKHRGNSGTDILFGISSIIKIQNQMLRLARSRTQVISVTHPWKAIDKDTIFDFNEEEMEEKLNMNCLLTYIDYGRYGSMKVNFDKFELLLQVEFQKLKTFRDDDSLTPQFDYKYESEKLTSNLTKLRDSGRQKPLSDREKEKIEEFLQKEKISSQLCPYALIFDFCNNILLPRATLSIGSDQNQLVNDFIQKTISESFRKKPTVLGCFDSLKMNQLFSFLLWVEILLFKENFDDNLSAETRLTTNSKDEDWKKVLGEKPPDALFGVNSNYPENQSRTEIESWTLRKNFKAIQNALMRLVLRTSFNSDNLDDDIEHFLKNPTLYDLDYNSDTLDDFSVIEAVKLKHCLVLLKSLENKSGEKRKTEEVQNINDFGTQNRFKPRRQAQVKFD